MDYGDGFFKGHRRVTVFVRKVCKDCGVEKVRCRNFYRTTARNRDSYMGACKDCHNAYTRSNRELKSEQYRETARCYDARPERVAARKTYMRTDRGRAVARAASRRYVRFNRLAEARA